MALAAWMVVTTPVRVDAQPGLTASRAVGNGVRYMEFTLNGPFTLDVLEVTLPNPYVHLETFRPNGLSLTSAQAVMNDRDGHRVIGAVNGDLFSANGTPVGNQVANGTFVHGVASSRSHLAIDVHQRPMIEQLAFVGAVRTLTGAGYDLTGVNVDRTTGALVFYTAYRGASTSTNGGVECTVEYLDSTVTAGDTLRVRITATQTNGNSPIPAKGGVLSASPGSPVDYLAATHVGDTLKLYLGFYPDLRHIAQVVAGAGRILAAGENVTYIMAPLEGLTSSFINVRNPRTFFAFNKDTTKVWLCTVDGRQTSSVGMTFEEMAGFLLTLGATDAFNLDGGGSTTMVVRGKTVNSPSDPGGERGVANSLQVISTAPRGTLAHLLLAPKRLEVYQGQRILFQPTGTNEYYDSIPLPPDLSFDVDPRLGTIATSGLYTAAAVNDSGWVFAHWQTARDSARVVVHTLARISPRSQGYVMAPGDSVMMRVLGTTGGGVTSVLENNLTSFTPSSAVVNVNGQGVVRAVSAGTGLLAIQYGGLSAQASFDCTGNDTTIVVDPLDKLDDWGISLVNATADEVAVSMASDPVSAARKVLLIDHSHLPGQKGVNFNTVLPLGGQPDSLSLRIYGSGNADTMSLILTDGNGTRLTAATRGSVDWSGEWRDAGFHFQVILGGYQVKFPLAISQMQVSFGTASGSSGFVQGLLYLADLRVHYHHRPTSGVTQQKSPLPERCELLQNYPNPFNPSTRIRYSIGSGVSGLGAGTAGSGNLGLGSTVVRLVVYDVLGREIAVLVDEKKEPGSYEVTFNGTRFASGVYFYRLTAGDFIQTRTFVLLR